MEYKKESGFMGKLKGVSDNISKIMLAAILAPLAEGVQNIMVTIEKRVRHIQKRITREIYSLFVIGFGAVFLIFALFFFLIEYLNWTKTLAFFSIGMAIFMIGLLLKLSEPDS